MWVEIEVVPSRLTTTAALFARSSVDSFCGVSRFSFVRIIVEQRCSYQMHCCGVIEFV